MKKIIITALVILSSVLGAKAQDSGLKIRNNSDVDPVIVCDGVVITKQKMAAIDPSTIVSMTVIKDDNGLYKQYVKNNEPGLIIVTLKKSDDKGSVTANEPKTLKIESNNGIPIRNNSEIDPVIVCDGVVITKQKLAAIDPSTIESMTVVKDDREIFRKYVKNNEPGVIIVTLKK